MSALKDYLQDPTLKTMWEKIRSAGSIKSISVDLTNECNLRCTGCYYFDEKMDKIENPESENTFDHFIESEKQRGTNFVTVVGGEPSLELTRLKSIYDNFTTNVATNGLIRIPYKGFENLPIGVAVWGNHKTDSLLRNNGKRDLFDIAKRNYKNDKRAFWYYTVSADKAHEIGDVVSECIENGNRVLFNYYNPVNGKDNNQSFIEVEAAINKMINLYPDEILMTPYFNHVITTGKMHGERWGYDVCTNLSSNIEKNKNRFLNGKPYNAHFRAYNADFSTTRRCCTGIQRDCNACFDTWEHFSWIMINLKLHLHSKKAFTNWLSVTYLFYMINRMIPHDEILSWKLLKSEKIYSLIN